METDFVQPFHCQITLLAEAFPLCLSALYCHSLRGFGCSRFVLVVLNTVVYQMLIVYTNVLLNSAVL